MTQGNFRETFVNASWGKGQNCGKGAVENPSLGSQAPSSEETQAGEQGYSKEPEDAGFREPHD